MLRFLNIKEINKARPEIHYLKINEISLLNISQIKKWLETSEKILGQNIKSSEISKLWIGENDIYDEDSISSSDDESEII